MAHLLSGTKIWKIRLITKLILGLHLIATNLEPIYEFKIMDFLDSWAVVKLLSSDRKLVFTSMSGRDLHTSKKSI